MVDIALLGTLAQEETADVSLTQALLLGIAYVLLFGISVLATGLVAQRLKILDAGYAQALWATVFKSMGSIGAIALLGVSAIPPGPLLALVVALLPVIIYKLVFQSTFVQAVLLWIVVLVVEAAAAVVLVVAALGLGAWLDAKLDMPL